MKYKPDLFPDSPYKEEWINKGDIVKYKQNVKKIAKGKEMSGVSKKVRSSKTITKVL